MTALTRLTPAGIPGRRRVQRTLVAAYTVTFKATVGSAAIASESSALFVAAAVRPAHAQETTVYPLIATTYPTANADD